MNSVCFEFITLLRNVHFYLFQWWYRCGVPSNFNIVLIRHSRTTNKLILATMVLRWQWGIKFWIRNRSTKGWSLNINLHVGFWNWFCFLGRLQVAGYVVGYKGLVFATVRESGHMVPTYQPQRALTLFSSFLQGILPPEWP